MQQLLKTKIFGSHNKALMEIPNLVQFQKDSYDYFIKEGIKNLLREVSPIRDYTTKDMSLEFLDYTIGEPKATEDKCKLKNLNYEAPLNINLRLNNYKTKGQNEQSVYFGDIPLMTDKGTFIVNGVERVIVSQLIRSPGVFFTMEYSQGRKLFGAKLLPAHGSWLEFETDGNDVINVRIDKKRKMPATILLRVFGIETDEEIKQLFAGIEKDNEIQYIENTLIKDPTHSRDEALLEMYRHLKPSDLAILDNAKNFVDGVFLRRDRYNLARVGRFKINQRLGIDSDPEDYNNYLLTKEDIIATLREIIKLNNDPEAEPDDIDNLSNRRVRATGELLEERVRIGLMRLKRGVQDRMSTYDPKSLTPAQLISPRYLSSALKDFLNTSELSQFMAQTNPLDELECKRRLTASGPGGLTKERATIEVRDVHPSHYGRICPIQTPEGQSSGLVVYLALYSRLNKYGFIETPYAKVTGKKVTNEIVWMDAFTEAKYKIAQGGVKLDETGKIAENFVEARFQAEPGLYKSEDIEYVDVSPQQILSLAANLIPFLEHDDARRALMAAHMQEQALPCIRPEAPLVMTGFESVGARDSGQLLTAGHDGEITEVDSQHIAIKDIKGEVHNYPLKNFVLTNKSTCLMQKPRAEKGAKVKKGDLLADGAAMEKGNLAIGQNLTVAFMPWRGYNYEDAIILSEKVLADDRFTSIKLQEFVVDVRDTKNGPEMTTPDIPNVSEDKLKNLDEEGIIRIGAEVEDNDILVGKISHKGETDLTPEERLLKAIFGEEASDVKDTSLVLKHGSRGRVTNIRILSRDEGDKLDVGTLKQIKVEVAELRKVRVGDKLSGRHGNKGVISIVLPVEDMPYLEDGTPVDIILNSLGVPSRMNIGQILETHLGWAADKLNYHAVTPPFDGATETEIKEELNKAKLPESGQVTLYDGYTGEPFKQKITVGKVYMLKLDHMVADKIHMRSIGPYSLITQQPLGGRAHMGGQRFGEMEVWALEGYGAAYTLQEMLTIKSDDVIGRAAAYESIIKGEAIKPPHIPAAFNVITAELKALSLTIDTINNVSGIAESGSVPEA